MGGLTNLRPGEFVALRDVVRDLTGIVFEDKDVEFMLRRLRPLAKELDCESFAEFLSLVQRGTSLVRDGLFDAITTRETSWFRDRGFGPLLCERLLPELAAQAREARRRTVRIWSAASSTGQEAYSVAIQLAELHTAGKLSGLPLTSFEIFGTDLSQAALTTAREGLYEGVAIERGLSPERRAAHFDAVARGYRVKQRLRALTRFERRNLTQLDSQREDWDLILLRNVLIYFEPDVRKTILERMARKLRPGGCLVMGGSEDPLRYTEVYERHTHGGTAFFLTKSD